MDRELAEKLPGAGLTNATVDRLPRLIMPAAVKGELEPLGDEVNLKYGAEGPLSVRLLPVAKLFEGERQPPSFSKGPTEEYEPFFMLIERTAADYCRARGRDEMDLEMERLYNQLRRNPDGRDGNPLFSYLRAAVRLYMSLAPVSRAEMDAVLDRLRRSAKTFGTSPGSRNYLGVVKAHVP